LEAIMPLFVVRHQHAAARCPAQDPFLGATLLIHLSRPSARKHGIRIQGEAVIQNEHTFYLIVEAANEDALRAFMQPFQMAGRVEIYPASTYAHVVTSGGCAAAIPVNELAAAVDPEAACQQAIDAGLLVHRAHPLNCETPIPALVGGVMMPNARFYVRNHFQIPDLDEIAFRLTVSGLVERPLKLSLGDLHNMRSQTIVATLECAGNGRMLFHPPIAGEKWEVGAVSTAEWTGVPLAEVLDRAGAGAGAREVVFRGADSGRVDDHPESIRFERSLQIDCARDPGVLLAYAMNGEPLPLLHGYPVRLIVPGWYAVASVKWLTELDVTDQAFAGYYQHRKYWYECERDGQVVREPVTLQRVRALITEPEPHREIRPGELAIRGVAWSGAAPIAQVDVSVDGGTWQQARLVGERHRHSWQRWELMTRVEKTGVVTVRARATDLAGRIQPEHAEWNRLGYGNNAIQTIPVQVEPQRRF
jgi:DMSO/TMAO reductase YedYZ molybdopterin-dependent catalytic subunit